MFFSTDSAEIRTGREWCPWRMTDNNVEFEVLTSRTAGSGSKYEGRCTEGAGVVGGSRILAVTKGFFVR